MIHDKYNAIIAEQIIKKLQERQMEAYYTKNKREAVEKILTLIPEGAQIYTGGSATLSESGIMEALSNEKYNFHDRTLISDNEERMIYDHVAFQADYYVMSSSAITLSGELINMDGNGNRLAALMYGPKNVIVVVGMNKLVANIEEGIKRIQIKSAPQNAIRLQTKTPCTQNGLCIQCKSPEKICCQSLVTHFSRVKNRIKVLLVGESLGF